MAVPLCMESTSYIFHFSLPDGVFPPHDHGLDFDISLCDISINQYRMALKRAAYRGSLRDGYHIQGRQQARKLPNPDTGSLQPFSW